MEYLQKLREVYGRLSLRQRLLLGGAAVAVIAFIVGLRFWQTERNFKPLFQDLAAEDAAVVLGRLKESGVDVRLADGGRVIKVPSQKVDELRIQMASSGLPKSGRIGFELFDKPNFGTSEFAEQVNYHRAVEGELERSVMAMQEVESARVHITFPRQSLFLENRQPAKASVLLKLKTGAALAPQNIRAISHLASSAVDGLTPENVSILDMRGNLLSHPKKEGEQEEEQSRQLAEYRERMEKDLRSKVQATLEPLLGPDGFRTAVSLDCDLASGDQSEESFDPSRSVMVNSQRAEDGSGAAAAGIPGTATNLPRPTVRPGSGIGSPLFRRSESATYQTSRVIRHIRFPQGQVKRLSVSVLLDHTVILEGDKRTVVPPPPEQLRAIKDIVAAAVGLQADRGDQIIVESLPFESTRNAPAPVRPAGEASRPRLTLPATIPAWLRVPLEGHLNWLVGQNWLPALVLALLLGLLYGLYRTLGAVAARTKELARSVAARNPFKKKRKGQHVDITLDPSLEAGEGAGQLEAGGADTAATLKSLDEQLRERDELQEEMTRKAMLQLEVPKAELRRAEVLTRHLVDLAQKDPEAVANLMRTWTGGVEN